jgi:hypothetical protein
MRHRAAIGDDLTRASAARGATEGPMSNPDAPPQVVQFRQILLWPIQLVPHAQGEQVQRHWELLEQLSGGR